MEHYEIKHYCWMSIEKGMVMGFMVPAMILILINTAIIILGLQSVNKKQAEMLTAKIQELVDHHIANWPKNEPMETVIDNTGNGSVDTLDIYTPGSSRKNTDSSDTLDREYNFSEDDCQYGNMGTGHDGNGDGGNDVSVVCVRISTTLVVLIVIKKESMFVSWRFIFTEALSVKMNLHEISGSRQDCVK